MKKNLIGIISIIIFFLTGIGYLIYTDKLYTVLDQFAKLNFFWLGMGILAILAYWFLESGITFKLVKLANDKYSFIKALKVTMIGQFGNGITPFSSGGQPIQLLMLSSQGIPLSNSASVLMSKFIIYQGTLVVYAMTLIILKSGLFIDHIDHLFSIVLIGFLVNTGVIAYLIYFSRAKAQNKALLFRLINFLHRIHLLKDTEKHYKKASGHIEDFHNNALELRKNKKVFFSSIILSFFQLTCYFLIPFFIFKSFNLPGYKILNFIAASAFVLMITAFIPIPGASGGAEGGFALIFGLFFLSEYMASAIVIWRMITYYFGTVIGGFWFLSFSLTKKRTCPPDFIKSSTLEYSG